MKHYYIFASTGSFYCVFGSILQGCSATGSLSKEDAAFICVEATGAVPKGGFTFEVSILNVYAEHQGFFL